MASDRQVIQYLSPAELAGLMNATGVVTVHETIISDGKPVIHAAVKVVNAQTGEQLSGGLPFSVVMFKGPNEPGYSNIAIGTIVPASDLKVALPRDYFNFCNQRFRFARVFPIDEQSFVIQMDLMLKSATREYVKFGFGLWGALFSQMLFELMGRGRESLASAAEAYGLAHTDFAQHIAASPDAPVAVPDPTPTDIAADVPVETESVVQLDTEAIMPADGNAGPPVTGDAATGNAETTADAVSAEEISEISEEGEALPVETAAPVPGFADTSATAAVPELSIAAGPSSALGAAETETAEPVAELTEETAEVVSGEDVEVRGEAKDAVPA